MNLVHIIWIMNRIKELRKLKKLTQEELGQALGYDQTTVSYWEKNSIADIETAYQVAEFLGTTVNHLLGKDEGVKEEIETIAAHHDGGDWTEEELAEIEKFKEFVKSRRDK